MNQPSQPVIWELVKGWPPKINDNRNSSCEKHRDGPWSWIHFKVIFTDCTHGKSQINPPFGASSTQECTSCSELKIPVTCKIRLQQLRRNADWKIDVNRVGKTAEDTRIAGLNIHQIFDGLYQESGFSKTFLLVYRRAKGWREWFVGLLVSEMRVLVCVPAKIPQRLSFDGHFSAVQNWWKCSIPYLPCMEYFPIHLPGPPNRKKQYIVQRIKGTWCSRNFSHLGRRIEFYRILCFVFFVQCSHLWRSLSKWCVELLLVDLGANKRHTVTATIKFAKLLEESGCALLTIHGRTVELLDVSCSGSVATVATA